MLHQFDRYNLIRYYHLTNSLVSKLLTPIAKASPIDKRVSLQIIWRLNILSVIFPSINTGFPNLSSNTQLLIEGLQAIPFKSS